LRALLDGDDEEAIGHYWIGKSGYPVHVKDTLAHRTIAQRMLGRSLLPKEEVHHINHNKLDNRRFNLHVCATHAEHAYLHTMEHAGKASANLDTHAFCTYHQKYEPIERFSFSHTRPSGIHNTCREATNEYRRIKGYGRDKFDWKARLNQQYRRAMKKKTDISWISQEGRRP
jgi:hypothetical protein